MQYIQIVMQCLSEIKNKKIMLVVAHPDDETLWFYESIQKLKHQNEIIIFCLTHAAVSKRGKELSMAAEKLGLKVVFGHCEDTGINRMLKPSELRLAFIKVFSKYKLDLAITHPPHGGEKPHPHHIQLNRMTKEFCEYYPAKFGFFCEQKLVDREANENNYNFSFKKKKYIARRLIQCFKLLSSEKEKTYFLIKSFFSILLNFRSYRGFEVAVNLKEKQSALANFESQQDVLKSYNSFYKKSEYLYLELEHSYRTGPVIDFFYPKINTGSE